MSEDINARQITIQTQHIYIKLAIELLNMDVSKIMHNANQQVIEG